MKKILMAVIVTSLFLCTSVQAGVMDKFASIKKTVFLCDTYEQAEEMIGSFERGGARGFQEFIRSIQKDGSGKEVMCALTPGNWKITGTKRENVLIVEDMRLTTVIFTVEALDDKSLEGKEFFSITFTTTNAYPK